MPPSSTLMMASPPSMAAPSTLMMASSPPSTAAPPGDCGRGGAVRGAERARGAPQEHDHAVLAGELRGLGHRDRDAQHRRLHRHQDQPRRQDTAGDQVEPAERRRPPPRPQAGASVVCLTLVLKQARLLSLSHPRPQAGASVVSVSPSSSSRRASVVSVSPSSSSRRASVVPAVRGACACLTLVLKQATYHAYSYWSLTDTIYQEAASTVRAQGTPGRSSYR
jgi:hypothetical protein